MGAVAVARRAARGRRARGTVLAALVAALLLLASACDSFGGVATRSGPASATVTAAAIVPDVTGKTGDIARDTLEHAGFVVSFKDGLRHRSPVIKRNWTVTAQSPDAGERASRGAEVTLTVQKTAELAPSTSGPAPPAESSSAGPGSPSPRSSPGP